MVFQAIQTKQMNQEYYTHPYFKSQEEILHAEADHLFIEPTPENLESIKHAITLRHKGTITKIATFSTENIWSVKDTPNDHIPKIIKLNSQSVECSRCRTHLCPHCIAVQMQDNFERDQETLRIMEEYENNRFANEKDYI